ncbi:MAG: hypothetical protein DWQ10_10900 [Calditrichaeota bacterium]|nr:MAG: hypothetical protein DWQ10_10900 [Calditrichota bacterium]
MVRNEFSKKISIVGFLLCTTSFAVKCSDAERLQSSQPPIVLGIAYDVSGSMFKNKNTVLQTTHIDSLISIVKLKGGALAFGLIHDQSFEPLIRLSLEPVTGRLDERAQKNRKNKGAITQFRSSLSTLLSQPRKSRYTDIHGALERFTLLFNEPGFPVDSKKLFLFLSDGLHDQRRKIYQAVKFPENVTVVAVGLKSKIALKLFKGKILQFESVDAAVSYIMRMEN